MTIITIRETMTQPVAEDGSALLTWNLVTETGAPVTLAQLGTLSWTHYDEASGDIVNSRSSVNIKNGNGGTVDPLTGACTLQLTPADNVILDPSRRTEWKVAFIRGVYNGGAGVVEKEIAYKVVALKYEP